MRNLPYNASINLEDKRASMQQNLENLVYCTWPKMDIKGMKITVEVIEVVMEWPDLDAHFNSQTQQSWKQEFVRILLYYCHEDPYFRNSANSLYGLATFKYGIV